MFAKKSFQLTNYPCFGGISSGMRQGFGSNPKGLELLKHTLPCPCEHQV